MYSCYSSQQFLFDNNNNKQLEKLIQLVVENKGIFNLRIFNESVFILVTDKL